jgi:hypothetical protein
MQGFNQGITNKCREIARSSIEALADAGQRKEEDNNLKGGLPVKRKRDIMIMQQAAARLETSQNAGFVIEATSHCRNGKMPRWSFLIQGIGANARHGMVGTDEQGRGLYLYASPAGQAATRQQLVAPTDLSLADTLSRHQANDEIMKLLNKLDWDNPQFSLKPKAPRFALYAVS